MNTIELPDIKKGDFSGKKVLVRLDTDVPLSETHEIEDDTRLVCGLPTVEYLLRCGAIVILCGHLGRPQQKDQTGIKDGEFSLKPIAKWFLNKFGIQNSEFRVKTIGGFEGWEIGERIAVLENLRFYKGEEENDVQLSQKLASLADVYVNDAFAVSHRVHASMVGVAKLLPHFAGLRLQEEVAVLENAIKNPKRPLLVIIGGAKLETKLPLVSRMATLADVVLVGGKIASEKEKIMASIYESKDYSKIVVAILNSNLTDITQESVNRFIEKIQTAQTVIWNGPVGYIEKSETEKTSEDIARAIITSGAYSIIGGGDTIDFLRRKNLLQSFGFVSTGGGAMLEFLSGSELPGLQVLREPTT